MRSELATKIDEALKFLEPNWIAYDKARIHEKATPSNLVSAEKS